MAISEEQAVMAALRGVLKHCTVCNAPYEGYWLRSAVYKRSRWPGRCMSCEMKFVGEYISVYRSHYEQQIEAARVRELEGRSQEIDEDKGSSL